MLAQSGNPFIRDIYTADPSAHVWADGRLYVYPSHDIDPPAGCDRMDKYHVYSTDDMVNWTDHGQILEAADVPWDVPVTNASTNATFMWAPDCAYKNGKYYFYFPHPEGPTWNNTWKIGIAVSDYPAKDFTVLPEPLKGTEVTWIENGQIVTSPGLIDPCVFIDDDGQVYLYIGGGARCYGGRLKDNMIEVEGELQQMTGLTDFHEGTWVFKRNGIYYLTYADNKDGANQLRYAIGNSPLGPWTYKGIYLNSTTCYTSHGSVVEYKGQWWAFYHTADLSGIGELRSICVDPLFFNENETIQVVKQTKDQGSPYQGSPKTVPGTIEAEDFNTGGQGIAYWDNTPGNGTLEYRPGDDVDIARYRQKNIYYVTDISQGEYINYTFEVQKTDVYSIDFVIGTLQAGQTANFYLEFDYVKTSNPKNYTVTYNPISALGTVTVPNISLTQGIHTMRFVPKGNFNFDKFTFKGSTSAIETVNTLPALIWPNPAADGIFHVQNIETQAFASVSDLNGKIVLEKTINQHDNLLDLSRYAQGIYFLKLQTNETIYTSKLINS
ncbi:hypothetical protein FACS189413_04860 [Bacteroidia bacterium]|nr:hypothetical protein FACS189413_04860 [Bacteroidia bacterium]